MNPRDDYMEEHDDETQPLKAAFALVARLGMLVDAGPINKWPDCWEYKVDDHWWIAVNGHKEARPVKREHEIPIDVPPFTCYVEYNGFPAGAFNPYGGCMAGGEAANEGTFIAAIESAISRLMQS